MTIKPDETSLKKISADYFGMKLDIDTIIVLDADVSPVAKATVFLTKKKQLLCYIDTKGSASLGDIQKIITRMGMKAELYVPPKGKPRYFEDAALEKFRTVFPGRKPVSDSDLQYYKTLTLYSRALVLISEVREGVIYQYDRDARTKWRPSTKFAYRRIKTS
jgi:hypothetical protein